MQCPSCYDRLVAESDEGPLKCSDISPIPLGLSRPRFSEKRRDIVLRTMAVRLVGHIGTGRSSLVAGSTVLAVAVVG